MTVEWEIGSAVGMLFDTDVATIPPLTSGLRPLFRHRHVLFNFSSLLSQLLISLSHQQQAKQEAINQGWFGRRCAQRCFDGLLQAGGEALGSPVGDDAGARSAKF
jgi:hypothetical protein